MTHFLSPSYAEKGLRRALCCVVVGRHRHDDGFTRSLGNVTCERCRSRLPYWDTADVSKPDDLDDILRCMSDSMKPLDDLLKVQSESINSVQDLLKEQFKGV